MMASKSDGIRHAEEEKLRIFQSTYVVYDMARLEPLEHLVADLPYKKSEPARTKFQWEQRTYSKKDECVQDQQQKCMN